MPAFNSRPPKSFACRSPVYSRNGIVATSQPLASAAGLEILAKGGNAADAAVAAGAALNVTEPTSTGIGGDMFALFYAAETKRITALNGSGRAPAALTLDRLKKEGFSTRHGVPPFHAHTVTVPGACAGWFASDGGNPCPCDSTCPRGIPSCSNYSVFVAARRATTTMVCSQWS